MVQQSLYDFKVGRQIYKHPLPAEYEVDAALNIVTHQPESP